MFTPFMLGSDGPLAENCVRCGHRRVSTAASFQDATLFTDGRASRKTEDHGERRNAQGTRSITCRYPDIVFFYVYAHASVLVEPFH